MRFASGAIAATQRLGLAVAKPPPATPIGTFAAMNDLGHPAPANRPSHLYRHRAFWAVLAVAWLFRQVLSTQTMMHHPDEVWQYLEPAYGLVTGRWIETWEFHAGIRGWLIPMLLYPPMALGHLLAPGTQLHIWLVRAGLSLLSLGVVASFYELAGRVSRQHGLIAAWVAAIWVEIFYFAPRSSGEGIALSLLMPAIAMLYRLRERPTFLTAFAAGCLLLLAAIVRFQYLPAIALIAAWGAYSHCRKLWLPLLLGNGLALVLGALADWIAGQTPFLWIYTNYTINLGQSRSALFGTSSPLWYIQQILATWGWTSLVLVPAIVVGARRLPMLLAVAVVIIGFHMAVPHKEYRFVLLAIDLLVLLAAVGSVDLAQILVRRWPDRRRLMMPLLGAAWFAMSVTVALTKPFAHNWGAGRDQLTSLAGAGARPDICGLALFEAVDHPRASYAFLNRNIPVLLFEGRIAGQAVLANQSRFNVVIAPRLARADLPPGYRLDHCLSAQKSVQKQRSCTFVRPGTCHGGSGDFAYNAVLTRLGH